MSASSIPYHLRPHKAVDRRLFVDLLARFERWRPLVNYAYVSMGAYPLEDHKMVHRRLGISKLISFDQDENVVARQKFNRPVGTCRCLQLESGELIDRFDELLLESDADERTGVVVWLDYTEPDALGRQIREFVTLLKKLNDGDVVRVTVNAHPPALAEGRTSDGSVIPKADLFKKRFECLKGRIGDYFPSDASQDDIRRDRLARLLSRSFGRAALNALPVSGEKIFSPLSLIRYADGQQMLSMTGALVTRDSEELMRSAVAIDDWPFSSIDWKSVKSLNVPDLTVRERMLLEQEIGRSKDEEIAEKLNFKLGDNLDVATFVKDYRSYYRFYPSLLVVDP